MASIQKTQGIAFFPIQSISANSVALGTAYNVGTALAATIFIHLGRDDTAGDLTTGVDIRIEASAKETGNDQWFPLAAFKSGKTAPESEALTGTVTAGIRTLPVASTANIARGDIVFLKNSPLEESEFHRVKSITPGSSVQIIDTLAYEQTGATLYDQAEMYVAQLDLSAIGRIRLVADGSGGGRSFVVEAYMVTGDSIS